MKFSEMADGEKRNTRQEIEALSSRIDNGEPYDQVSSLGSSRPGYGICNNCNHAQIYRKRYGGWVGRCSLWNVALNTIDQVEECSDMSERGRLSLSDMFSIAYLIEPNKNKIGLT